MPIYIKGLVRRLLTFFFLFLFVSSCYAALSLESCKSGDIEYKYTANNCDTITDKRICCSSGLWSAWGGNCSYTWNCRQVPKSYCGGSNYLIPSAASGSISGQTCNTYGNEGFSSGTTDGRPALASGANTACYQCKCGSMPTSPACNCSGLGGSSCTAYIDGAAYVGTRKCIASCLWDDCYSVSSPEGQYCGLTPGKTYSCTPAAYPEHGGYQVCESSYTDPGQLQISSCRACGANQCLAKSGGISSAANYYCVSKPSSGQDAKGKYNCTDAKCSSAGISTSPWTCTSKTYTSCFSGYTLSYGNCVSSGGGGGGIIEPGCMVLCRDDSDCSFNDRCINSCCKRGLL